MATEPSDFEQPGLVYVGVDGPGPADPVRVTLGAETQVTVTPLRDDTFTVNGLEFLLFNGVPRLVPQDLVPLLASGGYI